MINKLSELGITTSASDTDALLGNASEDVISTRITSSKVVVIFLTEQTLQSEQVKKEIAFAVSTVNRQNKCIIPIAQHGEKTLSLLSKELNRKLSKHQCFIPEDGMNSEDDYNKLAFLISELFETDSTKELLHKKLALLKQIGFTEGYTVKLSRLAVLLCDEAKKEEIYENRIKIYKEICQSIIELKENCCFSYSAYSEKVAKEVLNAVFAVQEMLKSDDFKTDSLLLVSIAITSIYHMIDIWKECIDTISYGTHHSPGSDNLSHYNSQHDMYCSNYNTLINQQNITQENHDGYTDEEFEIIDSAKKYFSMSVGK